MNWKIRLKNPVFWGAGADRRVCDRSGVQRSDR